MAADYCICPHQPYGQHIALYCKRHPDKRWSTKNIEYIGARSIFFFNPADPTAWQGGECSCSGALLRVYCKECDPAIGA